MCISILKLLLLNLGFTSNFYLKNISFFNFNKEFSCKKRVLYKHGLCTAHPPYTLLNNRCTLPDLFSSQDLLNPPEKPWRLGLDIWKLKLLIWSHLSSLDLFSQFNKKEGFFQNNYLFGNIGRGKEHQFEIQEGNKSQFFSKIK